MKRALLDTNAYSFLIIKGIDIADYLDKVDIIYMSCVVLGELYYGFRKGDRFKANEDILNRFLNEVHVNVCGIDPEVIRTYGDIAWQLDKTGRPIPTNDIWIAAQAIRMDAELVTFDGHFQAVRGLKLWKPIGS